MYKVFEKIVSSCDECPNKEKDHSISDIEWKCKETDKEVCLTMFSTIPDHCPLPNQ